MSFISYVGKMEYNLNQFTQVLSQVVKMLESLQYSQNFDRPSPMYCSSLEKLITGYWDSRDPNKSNVFKQRVSKEQNLFRRLQFCKDWIENIVSKESSKYSTERAHDWDPLFGSGEFIYGQMTNNGNSDIRPKVDDFFIIDTNANGIVGSANVMPMQDPMGFPVPVQQVQQVSQLPVQIPVQVPINVPVGVPLQDSMPFPINDPMNFALNNQTNTTGNINDFHDISINNEHQNKPKYKIIASTDSNATNNITNNHNNFHNNHHNTNLINSNTAYLENSLQSLTTSDRISQELDNNTKDMAQIYKCDQCDSVFTDSLNLIKHSKSHSDVLPHICNICGKSFARKDALKRHYKTLTCNRNRVNMTYINNLKYLTKEELLQDLSVTRKRKK